MSESSVLHGRLGVKSFLGSFGGKPFHVNFVDTRNEGTHPGNQSCPRSVGRVMVVLTTMCTDQYFKKFALVKPFKMSCEFIFFSNNKRFS